MAEVDQTERDTFYPLGQIVDCFGWSVGDVTAVPGADLWCPSLDSAAESLDFDWHLAVGEVTSDLANPFDGEGVVGVIVDLTHDFFRVSREPHLAVRVTGA